VLVTLNDGVPLVKVIDFGIAKAIQGRLSDQTLYTALDQFLGTPAYVSPEQIDASLGDVDFRSDIYSLGVLLYELLTGCTPISVPMWSFKDLDELRSRLRSQEPLIPSKRLRSLNTEGRSAAAVHRQTTAEKLIEQVSGDLDWIVVRCLEKDRERRYPTADALAADVQRFLSDEPVVARPPSTMYSLRKLAARHRRVVAATGVIMLILIVATVVSAQLAVRALHAEQRAQIEAATQSELSRFLRNDLLAQASPDHEPDRDLKLRTVLDRAGERIQGRFTNQPLVEAAIRTTLAEAYDSLGEYATSENHFRRALAIYQRQSGETNRNTLYASRRLIESLTSQGKYDEAEPLARKVLAVHMRSLGPEHQDTLAAMYRLAVPLFDKGERAAATELLVKTLEGYKRTLGVDHPDTLEVMNALGVFYYMNEKPAEAQKLLVRALELRQRTSGLTHPLTMNLMNDLAATYARLGSYADAERLMLQSVELRREVLGADHPSTLVSINNLANLYRDQGRLAEAVRLLERAVEVGQRRLGAHHPYITGFMASLGRTYVDQGKLDAAYELLSRTLQLRQQALGPEHPDTLISLSNLGLAEHRRGRLAQAEALLTRAWAASERVLGEDSLDRMIIGERLAAVWLDQEKFAAAESVLRSVSEARRKRNPEDWRVYATVAGLADALVGLGRYEEAEPMLINAQRELAQRAHTIPESDRSVLKKAAGSLIRLYTDWNKPGRRAHWEQEVRSLQ
jgi:tetratricopeptide (TPR) repeat protein